MIDSHAAALQCFHFWFNIDGFFDGSKNESLSVVQQSTGEVADNLLWFQGTSTMEWTEVGDKYGNSFFPIFLLQGQVEVRGELGADGTYTGWKVRVLATKPGEISAWLAVDDFR